MIHLRFIHLVKSVSDLGPWGEWLFIFRELGSTGNYFQGFGEQVHSFENLGSPAKKLKKSHLKGKAFILFDFFQKKIFGRPPQTHLGYLNIFTFLLTCLSGLY